MKPIFCCLLLTTGCATFPGRTSPPVAEITAIRAAYNEAIARRDTSAFADFFLPTYQLVTGRSVQRSGREDNVRGWAQVFQTDSLAFYVRTPRDIRVNEAWGSAEELGDWRGRLTMNGVPANASGRYAAKWHRAADGRWRLQSEVFTTFSCTPPTACTSPPPPAP